MKHHGESVEASVNEWANEVSITVGADEAQIDRGLTRYDSLWENRTKAGLCLLTLAAYSSFVAPSAIYAAAHMLLAGLVIVGIRLAVIAAMALTTVIAAMEMITGLANRNPYAFVGHKVAWMITIHYLVQAVVTIHRHKKIDGIYYLSRGEAEQSTLLPTLRYAIAVILVTGGCWIYLNA
jgi:hypothetical protein